MRAVRLYGELGKRFGRVHRLRVSSPAEAVRAMCANHPGFDKYLIESGSRGIGYKVRTGGDFIESSDHIHDPASGSISIIPAVVGANAEARILLGAALIVASFFVPPAGVLGVSFLSGSLIGGIGLSLALGGLAQMLSPPPSVKEPSERPENKPSYLFNGPVNTTAQGQPVPIGYGRAIVGGAVISAGIRVEQLKAGFKRIKSEATTEVYFFLNGEQDQFTAIPANWFKREFTRDDTIIWFGVPTPVKVWTYYYYVWTVVPT